MTVATIASPNGSAAAEQPAATTEPLPLSPTVKHMLMRGYAIHQERKTREKEEREGQRRHELEALRAGIRAFYHAELMPWVDACEGDFSAGDMHHQAVLRFPHLLPIWSEFRLLDGKWDAVSFLRRPPNQPEMLYGIHDDFQEIRHFESDLDVAMAVAAELWEEEETKRSEAQRERKIDLRPDRLAELVRAFDAYLREKYESWLSQ